MKITYYGHSCFKVEIGGKSILFDPFITPNPATAGTDIDVDTIQCDYILLSHGHSDHVADAERIARNCNAKIVGVYEVVSWFMAKELDGHGMNTGGKYTFDFGTVRLVNAVHSSAMPDGSYGGNPVGFVISHPEEGCFYFAGDTALTLDMKLIPDICPPLDFAILPIGDNFTMGYEDAVLCSEFINCSTIIGAHFDTFPVIDIDHDAAKKAFADKSRNLFLPKVGMSFSITKA
ncbi:MAG: metal-dependent hydrolase [Saprospiraceae bacterium]|nr:metal-dependent hydrolase [Saprospiraceae bacterium]